MELNQALQTAEKLEKAKAVLEYGVNRRQALGREQKQARGTAQEPS